MGLTDALELVPLDGRLGSAAMEVSSQAGGVTPDGVREGDRAALQALVERRGPAVMAFCTRVCGPANAQRAAAEAFARFRAAVRDAIDLSIVEPEALLRGATRHAAASLARTPSGPPPHGRLRSRGTQTCEHVPTMLAARANGALGEADLERLARHLDRCERCNALSEIFRSAEAAYAEPAIDTLGTDTTSALVGAMLAVPHRALGVAPEPLPGAPATEPQDGAFGHLPDLDDEIPVAEEPTPAVAEAPTPAVAEAPTPAEEAAPEIHVAEEPELVEEATPQVAAEAEIEPAEEPQAIEPEPAEEPQAIEPEPAEEPQAIEAEPDPDATAALSITEIEAPAEELPADALAAEPLPEAAPAVGEHEVELGETMEWDMVPVAPERRSYADEGAPVLNRAYGEDGAPVLTPGAARRSRRGAAARVLKVVLPVLLVAVFGVAALAFAGVIGGSDEAAPPVQHRVAPRVQKPVLTPLPVTVAGDATSTTSASGTSTTSTTTPSATTTSDAATAPGDAVGTTP